MAILSLVRLVILFVGILFCFPPIASSPISWLNETTEPFDFQYQRTLLHVIANEHFMAFPTIDIIAELIQKGIHASTVPQDPRTLWDTHVCLIPQLFSTFQSEQWKKARQEVNRYDMEHVMKSYSRPMIGDGGYDPHNLKFYLHPYYLFRMTSNGNHLRGSGGKRVQVNYFTIYKAASTYIRNLFTDFCKKVVGKVSWSEMYLFEWMKKDRSKRLKVSLRKSDGQYSFAIVRDPMARFISGFTELEQRRRDKKAAEVKVAKATMTQPKRLDHPSVGRLDGGYRQQALKCPHGFSCIGIDSASSKLDAQSKRRHWEEKVSNDDRLETFIFWLLRYDGSHSMVRECPECDHITPQGMLDCWMVVL